VTEVELGGVALLGIGVAAAVTTLVMMLTIRRWSDQAAIAATKAQAQAHLLECRLFREDPGQVLRSQRALALDNVRLLKLLFPSLALSALPMMGVLWTLDAAYSRAPLKVGSSAVVSVAAQQQSIVTPPGFAVETRPLFVKATGQTSWRIRPTQDSSGKLQVASMTERIVAGSGMAFLPKPLWGRSAIEIRYPKATVFSLPWALWFVVISLVSALILRRPLGVAL